MSALHVQHDFAGIDLAESYLIRFRWSGHEVTFHGEWALDPAHPLFASIRPNERACWHLGTLTISGFAAIGWAWLDIDPAIDATGAADLGNFADACLESGHLALAGDWGAVRIERPSTVRLELAARTPREG